MPETHSHAGHRKRIKEEFRDYGLGHFADHKVLELLLYYTIPRGDTNPIGHELIKRFGSFSSVLDAPFDLLEEVNGVGRESATFIKLMSAVVRMYMDDFYKSGSINDTEDAKSYMEYKFLGETRECVYITCLANNGKVIFNKRMGEPGTQKMADVTPTEVIRAALRSGAVRVVLAHNHPDGIGNPSSRDLRTTSILYEELKRVDVELIDHIIVAPDGVYSMVEHNMFPK